MSRSRPTAGTKTRLPCPHPSHKVHGRSRHQMVAKNLPTNLSLASSICCTVGVRRRDSPAISSRQLCTNHRFQQLRVRHQVSQFTLHAICSYVNSSQLPVVSKRRQHQNARLSRGVDLLPEDRHSSASRHPLTTRKMITTMTTTFEQPMKLRTRSTLATLLS